MLAAVQRFCTTANIIWIAREPTQFANHVQDIKSSFLLLIPKSNKKITLDLAGRFIFRD